MNQEKKLYEFLTEYEADIIHLCRSKVLANSESKPTSEVLDKGLPFFYKELIELLKHSAEGIKDGDDHNKRIPEGSATEHGKESLRLGYTISQVVHAYGALCQTITEFVQTKNFKIQSPEFHDLNLALDFAIAEAVTEFEKVRSENISRDEATRLGFLIHELGNSLAAASIAHSMIQTGHVGSAGVTSKVLSGALERTRHLIGSSLTEVRLRGHAPLDRTQIRLLDIVSEVEAAAAIMGKSKEVYFDIQVNSAITLTADRHLIFSALSNLVNNAVKFTKESGKISIRGKESGGRILIEVEDECGGLPDGKTEALFRPFSQIGADKSGMGLGLSLSRQAVELNQGKLTAKNIPGKGCVFTIDLPPGEKIAKKAA